jgi:hypothetical protein
MSASNRYVGITFRASLEECKRNGSDLAVISSQFGLIWPDTLVPYYDTVLKGCVPSRYEENHDRVVSPKDRRLKTLTSQPLENAIRDRPEVVVFLSAHYLTVIEDVLNQHMNVCRFRVMVKRPANQVFSRLVLEGKESIRPMNKYEDVLGRNARCKICGHPLRDNERILIRGGSLQHIDC